MEFVQEKVNEGRLLATLRLEDKILANGELPGMALAERSSLVRGILLGLMEQDRIEEAIKLVYQPGPARALFDGDNAGFAENVLTSAKQHQRRVFGYEVIELLAKNKQTDLLYKIATELPLKDECLEQVVQEVQAELPEQQRAALYNELAERSFRAGNLGDAAGYFRKSNNQDALNSLQEKLMEKPAEHFDLLVKLVSASPEGRTERLTELVRGVLQQPADRNEDQFYKLCILWKRQQLPLERGEVQQIKERLASSSSYPDPERLSYYGFYHYEERQEIALLWAKKKATEDPTRAYFIFRNEKYDGPEVLTAVRSGLERALKRGERDSEAISNLNAVEKEHLRALLPTVPRELQAILAEHLGEDELLLTLSKEYAAENDTQNAYKLWIRGGGDQHDPYLTDLRQKLIEQEFGKEGNPSTLFLEREDGVGQRMVYDRLIIKFPKDAYEIAQHLDDQQLLEQARWGIVEQDPFRAVRFFRFNTGQSDNRGIELAARKIAEKYAVPAETVLGYLQRE